MIDARVGALGELEHNPLGREPGRADGPDEPWPVDTVVVKRLREDVEKQQRPRRGAHRRG